jgi:hypothetical protein
MSSPSWGSGNRIGRGAGCVRFGCRLPDYLRNGAVLYGDAVAHINIARRVFDSRRPASAVSTVWLPLSPADDAAGGVELGMADGCRRFAASMAAYVFGVVGLFRLVRGAVTSSSRQSSHASAVAILRQPSTIES